jgi:hypothetical protein
LRQRSGHPAILRLAILTVAGQLAFEVGALSNDDMIRSTR